MTGGVRSAALWLAACLAGCAVAAPLHGATEVAEPGRPDPATLERRISNIEAWLSAPTDAASPGLLLGMTRSVPRRSEAAESQGQVADTTRFQLTAACTSLRFLVARAAQAGLTDARRTTILAFRDAIRATRSETGHRMHRGALANELPARQYVSFSNAICGDALLDVHETLGDDASLAVAQGIGDHFVRLGSTAQELLMPEPEAGGGASWGLPDRVSATGVMQATYTTWNLVAAPFLARLAAASGEIRYDRLGREVARFHLQGLVRGQDYFAARPRSATRELSTLWNLGYARNAAGPRHDFRDGRWHRQGDIRSPPTGTVGTDQVEYALEALERLGGHEVQVRALYGRYRGLPASTSCIDTGVSFSGYFRLHDAEPSKSISFGSYYDIVGAGILARVKRTAAPGDHRRAIAAIMANDQDWAMLDCNLSPVWSERGGSPLARRSVLVAAHGGLALIDALLNRP